MSLPDVFIVGPMVITNMVIILYDQRRAQLDTCPQHSLHTNKTYMIVMVNSIEIIVIMETARSLGDSRRACGTQRVSVSWLGGGCTSRDSRRNRSYCIRRSSGYRLGSWVRTCNPTTSSSSSTYNNTSYQKQQECETHFVQSF